MLRVRGQSQRTSWTYLLGRSPLEDQDGEKPKVTIMQKTNVTCPQYFDCVFVIPLGSHETSQAATVVPAFLTKEGSPAGRFMTCWGWGYEGKLSACQKQLKAVVSGCRHRSRGDFTNTLLAARPHSHGATALSLAFTST